MRLNKYIAMLLLSILVLTGCGNKTVDRIMEEGKISVANKEYEKAEGMFSLALEENKNDKEASALHRQIEKLIEAINLREESKIEESLKICNEIEKIESDSDCIKKEVINLKKQLSKDTRELNITNNSDGKENQIISKEAQIDQSLEAIDISVDFENKKLKAEEVLTKGLGFLRYYNILIEDLRSYNINDIDNANVVYEISDKLLNNMYQEFKANFNEDAFNELRDSQRIWVKDKMKIEQNIKDNELLKYQTLISITLDRCEEFSNYYR